MSDNPQPARIAEAERLLMEAIADVPLACSAREVAAAVQSIGLRLAERCMAPRQIAHALVCQAEGYLKAAGVTVAPTPPLGRESETETAHRILSDAATNLNRHFAPTDSAGLMLGFAAAWVGTDNPEAGAETLYRHADTLVGRRGVTH